MEIQLKVVLIWEDRRITSYFSNCKETRRLPSIRKNDKPYIWIPTYDISHGKEVKYLKDPIAYNFVELVSNLKIKREVFDSNATLIQAMIEWLVTIPCNFDYGSYPLDAHNCKFQIYFADVNVTLFDLSNGTFKKTLEKQGFTITKEYIKSIAADIDIWGRWATFGYNFKIKRQGKPYFLQYDLPSSAVVLVSFLSFVVPISAMPGRIGLVVTQFLTLTNLFIHQRVSIINCIKAH